jgi:hypothetical protein
MVKIIEKLYGIKMDGDIIPEEIWDHIGETKTYNGVEVTIHACDTELCGVYIGKDPDNLDQNKTIKDLKDDLKKKIKEVFGISAKIDWHCEEISW